MARISHSSALMHLLGACGFPRLDPLRDDAGKADDARTPADDARLGADAWAAVDAPLTVDAPAVDASAIDAPAINAAPLPIDAAAKSCAANGTAVTIGANHGHLLVVSRADVIAGVDKTYDIQGTSGHSHSATVTAAQFPQLQADVTTTLISTVGSSHSHPIMISCL